MDMDCEPALPAEPECYLPPNCVAEIAAKVTQQRNWVYQIMAMAGVNPLWRAIVSQLPATTAVTLEPQHKACSQHVQRDFLMGAAGLLSGYGSLVCRGQAIQDSIILKAASRSGVSWTSLRIEGAPDVSDRALLACGAKAPRLRQLALVGLSGVTVRGLTSFMTTTSLESLELADLQALDGGEGGGPPTGRQQLSMPNVLLMARLFQALPRLTELKLAAPAAALFAAIRFCPQLERLTYTADSPAALHAVVSALPALTRLASLSLTARAFAIPPETARLIGRLPLTSLRLDSAVYEAQCSTHQLALSHLDNDAVKALVDGVCQRWHQFAKPGKAGRPDLQEFKLSLRGATGLAHDAVSTLLRLPVLTELDVSGCPRISAMDRMRLVAKVKAGCEILAGQARRAGRPAADAAVEAGTVATPAEHGAFFRGERQVFGGPAASSGRDGSSGRIAGGHRA